MVQWEAAWLKCFPGNQELIAKRAGNPIEVKYILDLRNFPGDPNETKVVHDIEVILQDPEISIVCETMGGNEPAYTFSKRALEAGKSVCTSNKELVANHGAELLRLARENRCNYFFEASVGGGIPIIRPINDCLTAERIVEVSGILNGTTNYILTKMEQEGMLFEEALGQAQALGYAERNPEADVEGYDACRKIAILTSLVAGKTVEFPQNPYGGHHRNRSDRFCLCKEAGCDNQASGGQPGDGGWLSDIRRAVPSEKRKCPCRCQRCVQRRGGMRQYAGRYDVLRTRRRKAADCECGSRRCGGMRETSTENSRMPVGRGRGKSRRL